MAKGNSTSTGTTPYCGPARRSRSDDFSPAAISTTTTASPVAGNSSTLPPPPLSRRRPPHEAPDDKVLVITGAGSGIGRALALRGARDQARLAIADVDEAGLVGTATLAGE